MLVGWLMLLAFTGYQLLFNDASGQVPAAALQHQRELTRIVQQEFGLTGPVALHAAQIHQESIWQANVDSPVGAQGMAQFMPATSRWLSKIYPDLGAPSPYSESWAMRAMARYNRWHWRQINARDDCQRWAMTLSAYNGGLGWLRRDQQLASDKGSDQLVWFDHVEAHSPRASWAFKENRHYVRRIILELQPRYRRAGWQGEVSCPYP